VGVDDDHVDDDDFDIEKAVVDAESIAAFKSEEDFNELAFHLLREVASWMCLAGGVLPADKKRWSTGQAIIGGNLIRLFKLMSALLDQTNQHRQETTFVFTRLAFEAIVNINFLVRFASPELFKSYIRYSLKHERKLWNRINENIAARGGDVWPIEKRMLASIERTAQKSGVKIEDVSTSQPKNWGDKNLYDRADAVGLGTVYLTAFGGGSHSVHGNWMDLLQYHIEVDEDGFIPHPGWHHPRPQPLFMVARLAADLLETFFSFVFESEDAGPLQERLSDLQDRIHRADTAHEHFVTERHGKSSGS
jgi:hypothetical protein